MHPFALLLLGLAPLATPAAKTPPKATAPAPATAPDHFGRFRGAIEIPGTPLEIEVVLEDKNGQTVGRISIPAQKVKDMLLGEVKASAAGVSFLMPGVPGDPRFEGKAEPGVIKGTFQQGGSSFPFSLKKLSPRDETDAALKDLDATVVKALADFNVPGLAVGVVRDGEVVLLKGYGLRDVEKKLPVTPKTLFAIGSTTKAFTTVVMQQLVEEGKLDWSLPVRTYLPAFALKDEYAGAHLTPRDLVTHVSGMPRHDLVWYNNLAATREDMTRRLPFLEPNKTFRDHWEYNNMMFMVAGNVVEKITTKSWEVNVRDRIFVPLRMARSNFSVKESAKDADHAEPYKEHKDVLDHVHFRDITTAGPAGSINSCVEDMSRWMLMHLEGGTLDGKKVLAPSSVTDLHMPRAAIPAGVDDPAVPLVSYASGWEVDAYRGQRRVHHGGAIDGFIANVALFPDSHLGIVVLANSGTTGLPQTITKVLADRILGLTTRNWLQESLDRRNRSKSVKKESEANKTATRVKGTQPSRPLADFAGRYHHPGYGILDVTLKENTLTAVFNNIPMPLQHWHYDVFRSAEQQEEPDFEGLMFNFRSNTSGEIEALESVLEPTVPAIRFERQPDPRMSDTAFLAGLAGDYDLRGKTLRIEVRATTLVVSQAGDSPSELVPGRGVSFTLKDASVVRVDFVLDAAGKTATEMRISDPGGTVVAKRKPR